MRTIDRLSSTRAFSWLRGEAGRVRLAMMAQPPAVRLGLVLAPVLLLAGAGYWAAGTLTPPGPKYLGRGRVFSSDDLIKICKELDAKQVAYRPEGRKIEVAADQYDQAMAVLGKLSIGPRSVAEIRDSSPTLSQFLTTPGEREQQERLRKEQLIERFISGLDGVAWSVVCIQHPPRTAASRGARGRPSAFVYLESEADRPLPSQTVQAIPRILASNEPGLAAEAISVMDRKGRPYLDPSNPVLGRLTRNKVREQELRDEVADRLHWIKGVQIWVELGDRGEAIQGPAGRERTAADAREAGADPGPSPAIAVNRPAEIGEPVPPAGPAPAEKPEIGHVHVSVPRSSYYSMMLPHPDHREPRPDELQEAAMRTRGHVERLVRALIPTAWTLDVETIPDEIPVSRPAALPAGSDHWRVAADWGIIGAVAAGVAVVMAMGSWIQAARRPVRATPTEPAGRRYREDPAEEPEPSERVRELVRRDPEVAASVLQRWATQGGPAS
jgi:type III secretory pathway lipoprotein EscJ